MQQLADYFPAPSARSRPRGCYRLGYIGLTGIGASSSGPPADPQWDAFHDELRKFGYVEGQNLVVERRWIEGRQERIPELVAELLGLARADQVIRDRGRGRVVRMLTVLTP